MLLLFYDFITKQNFLQSTGSFTLTEADFVQHFGTFKLKLKWVILSLKIAHFAILKRQCGQS